MDFNAKILLVDDEEDILEFLKYNLKKDNYEIKTATNGNEAIKKAYSFKPDLIVLDIMMPDMDGIEVCNRLREDDDFNDTLIAFLTAKNESFTQVAAFDNGGDDYITKPIKPNVFKSRIKALLRRHVSNRKTNSSSSEIEFGDLKIDKEKYLVYKDNEKISLAKKEFNLLALLSSKPGKVFNREEILSEVWGREVIVGDRTVDVHVRKLREKIGKEYILTYKGIGYKFEF
jgi:two-component system alkaline phosphatase synthesis response regulator PhoP